MAVMLRPVERSGRQPDDRPSVQFQPPILCNFTPPLTRERGVTFFASCRWLKMIKKALSAERNSYVVRSLVRRPSLEKATRHNHHGGVLTLSANPIS
jgi:hypothetical protein